MLPTAGKVRVSGKLGYLPQDTHASDPTQTALDRMMSARDIATIINRIRKAEKDMTDPDPDVMSKAMTRYDKAMQDFDKAGVPSPGSIISSATPGVTTVSFSQ